MSLRKSLWLAILGGAAAVCILPAATLEPGFHFLFNGKDLTGWDGDPGIWSVREGTITGQCLTNKHQTTSIVWRDGMVDDFELRLSYRFAADDPNKGGHAGIQFRGRRLTAASAGNWTSGGYEAPIENNPNSSGALREKPGRGILAARGQHARILPDGSKVVESLENDTGIREGIITQEWNDVVIIAHGGRIVQKINGHVTVDVVDEQASRRARSGLLGFLLDAGSPVTVQFKDVQLKRLPLEDAKKIILIAGDPSHGPGDHEHNAGVALWAHCLDNVPGVLASAYLDCHGWPRDPSAFDNADAAVFFVDGGDGSPIIQGNRLKTLGDFLANGKGMAAVHYTVEVPKNHGGPEFISWIGGYYETGYSINPFWMADFKNLPEHPITRGVEPFKIEDEWYYNIRRGADKPDVVPLLTATPPDDTRGTSAAKEHPGRVETVSWCVERSDGGRGFGYTGGHVHKNWADDNARKFILNAIVWTAKGEIPVNGIESSLAKEDIQYNLDEKEGKKSAPAPWLPTVNP